MKHKFFLTALLVILTALLAVPFVAGGTNTVSVLVQADSVETAVDIVEAYGGTLNEQLDIINAVSATFPQYVLTAVAADSRTVAVHQDDEASVAGVTTTRRTPQLDATFTEVMGVDEVWDENVWGKRIGVAIVDTGIALDTWNVRRVVARYDALDEGTRLRDPHGHGTMMASLIGNDTKDANGYMGVAPKVQFIDVRALDAEGKGTYTDIIEGLNWILANKDRYNIRVVNLSLLGGISSPYWADPINQAVEALWDAGIVVVAAAGNGGPDPMTIAAPGNDPFVITVGAFTDNFTPDDLSDDYVAPFSGAGPTEVGFVKPDVIAPGAHMLTTAPSYTSWARENHDAR
ncbi:MAG: S8 family serine peptidase, partial [Anaerolineales bacterium]|nr:S8 family serine peptidase [Anaerolineales bacterium]